MSAKTKHLKLTKDYYNTIFKHVNVHYQNQYMYHVPRSRALCLPLPTFNVSTVQSNVTNYTGRNEKYKN